jgi:nitrosocyanin
MTMSKVRVFTVALTTAFLLAGITQIGQAGEVKLTVVNVQSPQGVKIWTPESVFAKKGDTVTLRLINKLDKEHGYRIKDFGVSEVILANKAKTITFKADKAGVFPIRCHLHPPHVSGQLVVLE